MGPRSRRALAIGVPATVAVLAVIAVALLSLPHGGVSTQQCTGTCLFNINGTITVEDDEGGGMMNITVTNVANYPFSDVSVVSATPGIAGLSRFSPFTNEGRQIGVNNELPIGDRSCGYYAFVSGGYSQTPYTITVRATLSDGQVVTEQAIIVSDG